MKTNILQDLLLINDSSVFKLYGEMNTIAGYFFLPCFMIAIGLEYFGQMDFGGVVKRLLIGLLTISIFYKIHTEAVDISLNQASIVLKKVSPKNLFVRKWTEAKLTTKNENSSGWIQKIAIPNLNDLLATFFFLMAKIFIWLLKLIFSTVYHLTYIFSGISGLLYLFGWTKNALKGSVQASLWCMLMPFVIVAILALVGNSFETKAENGELIIAQMDNIIWLFGITLLLLLTPVMTYSLVQGEGFHSYGAKFGSQLVSAGMKVPMIIAAASQLPNSFRQAKSSISSGLSLSPPSKKIDSGVNINKETRPLAPGASFFDQHVKPSMVSNVEGTEIKSTASPKAENQISSFVNKDSLLKNSSPPKENTMINQISRKPSLNAVKNPESRPTTPLVKMESNILKNQTQLTKE